MPERDIKAYELAAEVIKQILGLSTAIIAVSATLFRDVIPMHVPFSWAAIVGSWILLIVSVGYGISALRWLATMMYGPDDSPLPSLADRRLTVSARVHVQSFVAALVLLALFGVIELVGSALRW